MLPKITNRGFLKFSLLLFAALLCNSAFCAEKNPQGNITADHWAYRAISDLASRGLLAGYPQGAFTGPQTLTRFETASLVLRAVEGIGAAYRQRGEDLMELAQLPEAAAEEPAEESQKAEIEAIERGPGVYPEDIAMLEKLVAEFRTELAGIGVRVEEMEKMLASTQQRLEKVENEMRRHQISGYLQFRFTDDQAKPASNFSLRRARLNVAGPVSAKASYKLQLQLDKDSGKNVALRDAYIDIATGATFRLRAGQAKLPFGYELPESSAERFEPERALVLDMLFPDQRDIGLQWRGQAKSDAPIFDIGVVNGTGLNAADDNDRKNVFASAHVPFSDGSAALFIYHGRNGTGADTYDKKLLGAGAEIGKKTRFRSEYITGKDQGEDVLGWYAGLAQQMTKAGTMFVRYDYFDENRDRPDDLFRRWNVGWVEQVDPRVRLTLSWETRRVGSDFSEYSDFHGDAATLQLQVSY
jgi:hypothetical protein